MSDEYLPPHSLRKELTRRWFEDVVDYWTPEECEIDNELIPLSDAPLDLSKKNSPASSSISSGDDLQQQPRFPEASRNLEAVSLRDQDPQRDGRQEIVYIPFPPAQCAVLDLSTKNKPASSAISPADGLRQQPRFSEASSNLEEVSPRDQDPQRDDRQELSYITSPPAQCAEWHCMCSYMPNVHVGGEENLVNENRQADERDAFKSTYSDISYEEGQELVVVSPYAKLDVISIAHVKAYDDHVLREAWLDQCAYRLMLYFNSLRDNDDFFYPFQPLLGITRSQIFNRA